MTSFVATDKPPNDRRTACRTTSNCLPNDVEQSNSATRHARVAASIASNSKQHFDRTRNVDEHRRTLTCFIDKRTPTDPQTTQQATDERRPKCTFKPTENHRTTIHTTTNTDVSTHRRIPLTDDERWIPTNIVSMHRTSSTKDNKGRLQPNTTKAGYDEGAISPPRNIGE